MDRELSYPSLLLCLVMAKLPVLVAQRDLLCQEVEVEEQTEGREGQQSSGEENSDFEHIDDNLDELATKYKLS